MDESRLQQIMDDVEREFGCGGLAGSTLYGEFAMEVAKRAVAEEREACAKACEDFDFNKREEIEPPRTLPRYCAAAIRMRSN